MHKAQNIKSNFSIFKKKMNKLITEFYNKSGSDIELDIININRKIRPSHSNWKTSQKNLIQVSHFKIGIFNPNGGRFDYNDPDFIPDGYLPPDINS
ncbi:hypothetical protein D3C72_855780 [compost metagenome]